MRVLLDAHMVGRHETGNETYVTNLAISLANLSNVQCAAAVTSTTDSHSEFCSAPISLLSLGNAGDLARLSYRLAQLSRGWRAEILHVTYIAPFLSVCPLVVSVHDVSFKSFPHFFSRRDRLLFRTLLPLSMKRAAAIITISEHAKLEIESHFPDVGEKVYVTSLAPAPRYRQISNDEQLTAVRKKYGISSRFVLAVGNLQPRKNLRRLIRAFSRVREHIHNVQLVIVGKEQWKASEVYDLVRTLEQEDAVIFTGYVPDDELVLLYNAAAVFAYPSIYEGFGLPILEAMACGVPVLTSNTSSMPEVAGTAALRVNALDEQEIGAGLAEILNSSRLATNLIEAGLHRVQAFSWQKTAEQTASIYRKVLSV